MDRETVRLPAAILVLISAIGLPVATSRGQELLPVPPSGPMVIQEQQPHGPIHRALDRLSWKLHDRFIGRPENFVEPPLGFSVREFTNLMEAKAQPHQFTLYQSDFLANSTELAPGGAQRLSRMAQKLPGWMGPIVIEWTPESPFLAQQRKDKVVNLLASHGIPLVPEQVLIGASPYQGGRGDQAALSDPIMILRSAQAEALYPVPPTPVSLPGLGGVQ